VRVLHEQELLGLHGVGHVALLIDTAREVSAARHAPSALMAHLWPRPISMAPPRLGTHEQPHARAATRTSSGNAQRAVSTWRARQALMLSLPIPTTDSIAMAEADAGLEGRAPVAATVPIPPGDQGHAHLGRAGARHGLHGEEAGHHGQEAACRPRPLHPHETAQQVPVPHKSLLAVAVVDGLSAAGARLPRFWRVSARDGARVGCGRRRRHRHAALGQSLLRVRDVKVMAEEHAVGIEELVEQLVLDGPIRQLQRALPSATRPPHPPPPHVSTEQPPPHRRTCLAAAEPPQRAWRHQQGLARTSCEPRSPQTCCGMPPFEGGASTRMPVCATR
jgi:hypothetical protein